ncbi:MAG: ArsA-related P-loop ATPase [Polyangiales bacterium]
MSATTSHPIDELLRTRRLIVCVGPGGVGKTTSSAAMALRAARMGRRALVLTIDPAKRLADALGLDGLDDEVRRVPGLDALEPLPGVPAMGSLDAAMLDTKASYDALLTRLTDGVSRDRIFANRAYQAFSRTMARSHAYVAMERLLQVFEEERWDLIVLDTPPTRSALDILDAPERLSRFLDERIVQWFLGGAPGGERSQGGAARDASDGLGGRAVVKLLGVLVGPEVVQELVSFFSVLAHLQKGFRERAARTTRLLESPATAFVLTAAPMPSGLADAANLLEGLRARGVRLSLLLFNRAYTAEPVLDAGGESQSIAYEPLRAPGRVDVSSGLPGPLNALAERLLAVRAAAHAENQAEAARMRALQRDAAGAPAWLLPRATRELNRLHDLSALLERPVPLGS